MRWPTTIALTVFLAVAESRLPAQSESPHRKGPHGLEGWTLLVPIENQGDLPMTLVIAQDNKIMHKFPGDGFVWNWIFLNDGRQVAYESGPLHFALACVLVDVQTGKEQARFDCFSEPLPQNAPAWVKQLEAHR
jgi:hypothetical protein